MADKTTYVVDAYGRIGQLPSQHVDLALREETIQRVASPDEILAYEREAKYGTPGQMALTAAEGIAAGATFGLSTVAEKELGVDPEGILGRQAANPMSALAGEAVGMVAPSLLSGGTGVLGAAGKALRATPAGLLETGARALERGVGSALGGGLTGRLAQSAAGGAAWGAAVGAGTEISEAALGDDHEFNAEGLLAAIGTGALLGGGLTGAGRLLGDTLGKGARALGAKVSPDAVRKFSDARAFEALGEGQLGMRQIEKAMKAFGPEYKEKVGAIAKDKKLFDGLINSAEDIHERAVKAVKDEGKALGKMYDDIDSAALSYRPDRAQVAEELRVQVIMPLRKSGEAIDEDIAAALEKKYLKNVLDPGEQIQRGADTSWSFNELWNKRKWLDDHIHWDVTNKPASEIDKALISARNVLEDVLQSKGQQAAKSLGDDFLSRYTSTKRNYAALKTAEAISQKRVITNETHQSMGWEPLVSGGIIGGVTGLATGDMSFGAAGAAVGGFAASRLQTQVSALIKKYATSAMAVGLDDLSRRVGSINKVINSSVEKMSGVAKKTVPISMMATPAGGEPLQARFDEKSQQYDNMTPQSVEATVAEKLKIMGPVAPATLAILTQRAQAAVAHIQSAKPRVVPRDEDIFTGLDERPAISDRDMAKWLRVVAAAENPMSVIRSLGTRELTGEGTDTLRAVYPALHARVTRQLLDKYAQVKVRPSIDETRAAGKILGSPVASYHGPRFARSCQSIYATRATGGGQTNKQSISIYKNIKGMYSGAQALEARKAS